MAADKPLQEIFSTVRIPITDAVVAVSAAGYSEQAGVLSGYFGVDYGHFHNCYPQFFSDRSQNQYSSQFDTWLTKRHPMNTNSSTINLIPDANLTFTHATTGSNNMVSTNLDDVFIFSIYDPDGGGAGVPQHKIIQYRPLAATCTNIGVVAASTTGGATAVAVTDTIFLSETVIANVATLVVTWINTSESKSDIFYATSVGGVYTAAPGLVRVTDADCPSNLANTCIRGNVVHQDGWTYVMTKQGNVYNSELNSITSWNSLGFVSAQTYPDQGVGLIRYRNHILAFGEDSIEFFNNAGTGGGTATNPKSPLIRTEAAFIKFGAMTAKGIIAADNTIYWWTKSSSGNWGMYKLDGYTPVKVSNLREDILAAKSPYYPELYPYQDNGKQHIMTTIPCYGALMLNAHYTNALTTNPSVREGQPSTVGFPSDPNSLSGDTDLSNGWLTYDTTTGCFWGFAHASGGYAFPLCAINYGPTNSTLSHTAQIVIYSYANPRSIVGVAKFGNNVHTTYTQPLGTSTAELRYVDSAFSPSSTTNAITAGIQFNVWDFGTEKRKRIHKFKVLQRMIGTSALAGSTFPYTWVIWNKTDGEMSGFSANDAQTTKIHKRAIAHSSYIPRSYLNNLGAARKWYFAIVEKSELPFMCKGIELDISQSTN